MDGQRDVGRDLRGDARGDVPRPGVGPPQGRAARRRGRRALGLALALLPLLVAGPAAAAAEPPPEPIAVLGFELVDDHPGPADAQREAALQRRLAALQRQLEAGLAAQGLYRVVDTAPARTLIDAERARHAFLYRCHGCLAEIGQRLETRLVALGWVQRVSELILNVNVLVKDAGSDAELMTTSVDLRGNTDETWERGMRFLLRGWAERRARDPRHGR